MRKCAKRCENMLKDDKVCLKMIKCAKRWKNVHKVEEAWKRELIVKHDKVCNN